MAQAAIELVREQLNWAINIIEQFECHKSILTSDIKTIRKFYLRHRRFIKKDRPEYCNIVVVFLKRTDLALYQTDDPDPLIPL